MTRINLVDPALLTDKHLGAEYRELPRIYGLVLAAQERGMKPADFSRPDHFILGTGHVKFFYTRLNWLGMRYSKIVKECYSRGRKVSNPLAPPHAALIRSEWFGEWEPTKDDVLLSVSRIMERGGLKDGLPFNFEGTK